MTGSSDLMELLRRVVGGKYRIESELGGGGMSRVFRAVEVALNRQVVIKVLSPELTNDVLAARFKREFEITAQLQHPHIVPVLDTGAGEGVLYYVIPYIEGESLRHRLEREGKLKVTESVRILSELAGALNYANARGVVHRDIKPENVLLSDGHAVLTDFGIAGALSKSADANESGRLTEVGFSVGTPGYMSPEQAAGERELDGRSDQYSLAIVGYEMVTGAPPFTGSAASIVVQHITAPVPPPDANRPDIPPALSAALLRALSKQPPDRFPTAAEFGEALGISYTGGTGPRVVPAKKKHPLMFIGPAVAIAASLVTIFVATGDRRKGGPAADLRNLIAIAPFDVYAPNIAMWKEGIADLLAANLDGAGDLKTVPPSLVVSRWKGRFDVQSGLDLAKATNAGIAVIGSVVGTGRDSVQVRATVVDAKSGGKIGSDIEIGESSERMDRVANTLTLRILERLGETRALAATRQSTAMGTTSVTALKEFLQGEQFFRRSDWDSAAVHYRRAIEADSNFAPALRHLSNALGWKVSLQGGTSEEGPRYALRAGQQNRGLAPRESLLVAADSIFAALGTDRRATFKQNRERSGRLVALLRAGVRRMPQDPEIWFKLGDTYFHHARTFFPSEINRDSAYAAFREAIALDSAFAPAYIHQIDLAARLRDEAEVRQLSRAYLALNPQDDQGQSARLVLRSLDGDYTWARPESLGSASMVALRNAFTTTQYLTDTGETQVALARGLSKATEAGNVPPIVAQMAPQLVATTLAFRGHIAESQRAAGPASMFLMQDFALIGAIPPDSADRYFDRLAAAPDTSSGGAQTSRMGFPWWLERGDTARMANLVRRTGVTAAQPWSMPQRYAEGLLELTRGDTARAIAKLAEPDSVCEYWCPLTHFVLARIYLQQKRYAEAARLLDEDYDRYAPLGVLRQLDRGRAHEAGGDKRKAIDAYSFVVEAWRKPDSILTPYVDEAKRALTRLRADARKTG